MGEDKTTDIQSSKDTEKDLKKVDSAKVPVLASCRLLTSYMCFMGMMLTFAARANIVMALVCLFPKEEPDVEEEDFLKDARNLTKNQNDTGLDESLNATLFAHWNDKTQGLALSAYNYGYLISPILGGYVATKSAKYVLFGSMLLSAIVTVLTPLTMTTSAYITIGLRAVVGLCGGVYEPSMQHLVSSWAPKQERAKLTALTQSGIGKTVLLDLANSSASIGLFNRTYRGKVVGNVISFAISGVLCKIKFLGGWPVPFYGTGVLSVIWCFMVLFLVYDNPEKHPRISEVEKKYITSSLSHIQKASSDQPKPKTPWLKIMTSLPFIACLVVKFSGAWVFNVQTLNQPMWVRDVLKFGVEENGLLSALPYVGQFIGSLLSGVILDLLTHTSWSTTRIRKATFCLCFILPGAALFSLAFLTHETRVLAICLTVFTTTVYSAVPVSLRLVVVEIAPRYTGLLMGVVTTLGSIPGMVAPLITSILTYEGSVDEWDEVFYMCAGMYVGAAIVFLIFGSSVEQPWAGGSASAEINVDPEDKGDVEKEGHRYDSITEEDEVSVKEVRTESMASQTTVVSRGCSDTESARVTPDLAIDNPSFVNDDAGKDHPVHTKDNSDRVSL